MWHVSVSQWLYKVPQIFNLIVPVFLIMFGSLPSPSHGLAPLWSHQFFYVLRKVCQIWATLKHWLYQSVCKKYSCSHIYPAVTSLCAMIRVILKINLQNYHHEILASFSYQRYTNDKYERFPLCKMLIAYSMEILMFSCQEVTSSRSKIKVILIIILET